MSCWSVLDLFLHPRTSFHIINLWWENISQVEDIRKLYLRIYASCCKFYFTTIECSDGTKVGLRKGDTLIYPACLKHHDPDLFGSNPYAYQYNRFIIQPDQPKPPSTMLVWPNKTKMIILNLRVVEDQKKAAKVNSISNIRIKISKWNNRKKNACILSNFYFYCFFV